MAGYKEIPLSKGMVTIVDSSDYEELSKNKWYYSTKGYAVRDEFINGKKVKIWMHRRVSNPPLNKQVDHINHDKLDNRRDNLRHCTNQENHANKPLNKTNSSGYKGVSFHKETGKWRAAIEIKGKKISLGLHHDIKEAAKAYNLMANKSFGEYAYQNHI